MRDLRALCGPGFVAGARPPAEPARGRLPWWAGALVVTLVLATGACGGRGDAEGDGGGADGARSSRQKRTGGGPPGGFGGAPGGSAAAVPVEVALVERRTISAYLESNGTLEAENEVAVVARTSGPIVELSVEEGDRVRRGQTLARIDDEEIRARVEIARVNLEEARQAYERAARLRDVQLISPEDYETASSRYQTAKAQLESDQIQLSYTRIKAPFDGLLIERDVQFAQQVSPGTMLFRLSDFDPLLCPIQVPERELARLAVGQSAYITVEAFGERRFDARVQRIRPVVDAATGTVKVTLEVDSNSILRPGMFARVFLRTDTREQALVIPKTALSLGSIGDTVFVARDGVAERREVRLGFTESDSVEILDGVEAGEAVVTVGQDALSDGTPIEILAARGDGAGAVAATATPDDAQEQGSKEGFDPAGMSAERIEELRARMRERGLSEAEIDERLEKMRQRAAQGQ